MGWDLDSVGSKALQEIVEHRVRARESILVALVGNGDSDDHLSDASSRVSDRELNA